MAKILLIQPNNEGKIKHIDAAMPLGLIYLGTVLEENNHYVKILDRNLNPSDEHLKNLLKLNFDFVGLGSYTGRMLYDALAVSKIVKENSNSIMIWGGFHPTIVPEQTLQNPFIDHIVRGEAEEIFLNMINLYEKGKDFSHLNGVDLNPAAQPPNLENLPLINYKLVNYNDYHNFYVSTSRGCPYRCTFCYNSYGEQCVKPFRDMSFEKTIQLIERVVYDCKKRTFTIVDDNFPSDRERVKKISHVMRKMDVKFDTLCRANYADLETLSYLKKAGCWQLQIGIESGSQRILNFMKKGTTVKMNSEAVKNCHKIGIMAHCSFMLGIPTETIADINETLRFIKMNKPDLGGAGIFHPFPKTKLWDYCMERNLIKEPASIEEWADAYPTGFKGVKMNVSGIPNEVLLHYHAILNKMINQGRYSRKVILYLKNRRIPDYRRVISVIKSKI